MYRNKNLPITLTLTWPHKYVNFPDFTQAQKLQIKQLHDKEGIKDLGTIIKACSNVEIPIDTFELSVKIRTVCVCSTTYYALLNIPEFQSKKVDKVNILVVALRYIRFEYNQNIPSVIT
ncbi:hypothetical protein J3Q64DRAFT_1699374 [Phycomyces blakesleeanus]|uniref:Uncharacterized protein n=2 Tax=Phycomyces blakesleeanus TaxID=4837 RepID=A0A163DYL2_PHYB8|nr:hypothetical protein PHYBLDRAFT_167644 [Phycomyces blakesleeanus NRRL 1555(-)]OAD74220.1 hypothetical protein PHYBLDRAFT_167644 [Phycomyces blakesleeanus NRRL 1555(-)]|eukprot:XP_018292260.1 hypothetical protein PHYBLDRAFT_167644 [Phycomyces blakesleeanus NRRL 1555(-)]